MKNSPAVLPAEHWFAKVSSNFVIINLSKLPQHTGVVTPQISNSVKAAAKCWTALMLIKAFKDFKKISSQMCCFFILWQKCIEREM